jgi:hypothetical protein
MSESVCSIGVCIGEVSGSKFGEGSFEEQLGGMEKEVVELGKCCCR